MDVFLVFAIGASLMVTRCSCACTRRGVECIDYQIVGRFLGHEERQYPATTWVSTTTEGPSLSDANSEMYRKLFSYTQANNVKGIKMNATTPIRTRIVPCHGATCATIFIMSFLIPADVADSAPYPLDTALFIEKDPPARYAVRYGTAVGGIYADFIDVSDISNGIGAFEGRATEMDWLEESHRLAELLKKDPTIDKSYYYTAWYDPPYQLFHRTNEIWMVKKTEQHPTTPNDLVRPEP